MQVSNKLVINKRKIIQLLKLQRLLKLHKKFNYASVLKRFLWFFLSLFSFLAYFPCVHQKLEPVTCIRSLSSQYSPIGSSSFP